MRGQCTNESKKKGSLKSWDKLLKADFASHESTDTLAAWNTLDT
jgi:hypothetical protein